MNPFSIFIVICISITFAYFLGLAYFLSDFESEECMPTYMFEYPQFVVSYLHKLNKFSVNLN